MRIQVIFEVLVCLFLCSPVFANCFDFNTKVIKPLREPLPLIDRHDNTALGKLKDDVTWGALRGVVKKPIGDLYKLLLDHNNTRSPRVDEMEVQYEQDPKYLAKHQVHFLIKPFPLIKIRWTEEWGFALANGTLKDPKEIVISYQKTEGTSHIEHLCGNIVLRKLTPSTTDVFEYEEAKATQRSPQDTLEGLKGTMRTMRK